MTNLKKREQEAERIRQKILNLGYSEKKIVSFEEHDFPTSKYLQYAGFDGDFNHCRGSS